MVVGLSSIDGCMGCRFGRRDVAFVGILASQLGRRETRRALCRNRQFVSGIEG